MVRECVGGSVEKDAEGVQKLLYQTKEGEIKWTKKLGPSEVYMLEWTEQWLAA